MLRNARHRLLRVSDLCVYVIVVVVNLVEESVRRWMDLTQPRSLFWRFDMCLILEQSLRMTTSPWIYTLLVDRRLMMFVSLFHTAAAKRAEEAEAKKAAAGKLYAITRERSAIHDID